MSDPNINATAQSVSDKLDGIDGNGNQLPYLLVDQLAPYQGPGIYFPAESPNQTTSSTMDKVTTQTKIVARTYKGLDLFDMVVALYQAAGEPKPHA